MRKRVFTLPVLSLLFAMFLLGTVSGCCDRFLIISGKVTDSITGDPIDSVRVTLYRNNRREIEPQFFEYTDSAGYFLLEDFGYCGNTRYFIVASRRGYQSLSIDIEDVDDVEIGLEPE